MNTRITCTDFDGYEANVLAEVVTSLALGDDLLKDLLFNRKRKKEKGGRKRAGGKRIKTENS